MKTFEVSYQWNSFLTISAVIANNLQDAIIKALAECPSHISKVCINGTWFERSTK